MKTAWGFLLRLVCFINCFYLLADGLNKVQTLWICSLKAGASHEFMFCEKL